MGVDGRKKNKEINKNKTTCVPHSRYLEPKNNRQFRCSQVHEVKLNLCQTRNTEPNFKNNIGSQKNLKKNKDQIKYNNNQENTNKFPIDIIRTSPNIIKKHNKIVNILENHKRAKNEIPYNNIPATNKIEQASKPTYRKINIKTLIMSELPDAKIDEYEPAVNPTKKEEPTFSWDRTLRRGPLKPSNQMENGNKYNNKQIKVENTTNETKYILITNIDDSKKVDDDQELFRLLRDKKIGEKRAFKTKEGITIVVRTEEQINEIARSGTLQKTFGSEIILNKAENLGAAAIISGIQVCFDDKFIEEQIKSKVQNITKIKILKARKKTAKIWFSNDNELKDFLERKKLSIGYDKYVIRLSVNKPRLCQNCGKIGHSEGQCPRKAKCLRCAEDHLTNLCKSKDVRCINCRGDHETNDKKCKVMRLHLKRKREEEKLALYSKNGDEKKTLDFNKELEKLVINELKRVKKKLKRKSNEKLSKLRLNYSFVSNKNLSYSTIYDKLINNKQNLNKNLKTRPDKTSQRPPVLEVKQNLIKNTRHKISTPSYAQMVQNCTKIEEIAAKIKHKKIISSPHLKSEDTGPTRKIFYSPNYFKLVVPSQDERLGQISKLIYGVIITKINNSLPSGGLKVLNIILKNLDSESYYSKSKRQIRIWFENEADRNTLINSSKLGKLGKHMIVIRKATKEKTRAVIKKINYNIPNNFIESEIRSQLNGIKNIEILLGEDKKAIISFETREKLVESISKRNIKIGYEIVDIKTKINTRSEKTQIQSNQKHNKKSKESSEKRVINLATLNIRSIVPKLDELKQFLTESKTDIAQIQETWVNENTKKYLKFNGYESVINEITPKRGGGLLTLIKKGIKFEVKKTKNYNDELEIIAIKIKHLKDKSELKLINVYIHPNCKTELLDKFKKLLGKMKGNVILSGDLNAHHKKWSKGKQNKIGEIMQGIFREYGFVIKNNIQNTTHFNQKTKESNSPDIVATNIKDHEILSQVKVGEDIGSDHLPMHNTIDILKPSKKINRNLHWQYKKCIPENYEEILSKNINRNTSLTAEILSTLMIKAATNTCKRTKKKISFRGNPWWSEQVKKQVNERKRLRRIVQKTGNPIFLRKYKKQIINTKKIITKAKQEYLEKVGEKSNLLDIYKKLKYYSKDNKGKILIDNDGEVIKNEKGANEIAEYFSKIGQKSLRNITTIEIKDKKLKRYQLNLINGTIKLEEIKQIIEHLNLRKAAGIDGIYPFMLKYGGETSIKALVKLFNKMFKSAEYPNDWRKGEIIVIPKSNNRKLEIKEFRPICLLPVVGKIFEKIITTRLSKITELEKWLPNFQNGFRKNRSTTNNLIEIQQEIHGAFKRNEYVLAVFLDIKKAYDCVNRDLLLKIMTCKGVEGPTLEYLKFFLSERKNRVSFNGIKSKYINFPTGVPQGSPLSPLLFNIYLSDIQEVIRKNISQFADDLVIWSSGKDLNKLGKRINKKLGKLNKYIKAKNLTFSAEKCSAVVFTRKTRKQEKPELTLNGEKLDYTNEAKYLGIILDSKLNWNKNTENIKKKSKKRIGNLKNFIRRNHTPQNMALTLYKSKVRPVIEYGSEIWGDISKTNKIKLDSLEHEALTSALGVNRLSKKTEVNLEAKVMPLEIRRKRKLIRIYQRTVGTKLECYINGSKHKRLKKSKRQSYGQRLDRTLEEIELSCEMAQVIRTRNLDALMIEQWKILVERDRNQNKSYNEPDYGLKYKVFTTKRTVQKIWHQARLNVIPTNDLLYKIKCSANFRCKFDNQRETNEHFLVECRGYRKTELRKLREIETQELQPLKIRPTQINEAIKSPKQFIIKIVGNIVEKTIEIAQKQQERREKNLRRILSGKKSRKRKYEIAVKILRKLKLRKTLTQKSELRASTSPSPDKKGDTTSTEYGVNTL